MSETFNLVVVSAGTSDPSSTRLLADRTAQRVTTLAERRGAAVRTRVIDLRELATDITTALTSQLVTPRLQQAVDALGAADGIIAAAPVYKAGPSGLFTSFFHVLDNDLLIGKPVVLAATAGTARHALVVDDQMRALFAYLRTLPVPTSLFAAPEDWGASAGEPGAGEEGALEQAHRPRRVRTRAAHGIRLRAPGARRVVAKLPARVRLGRRHGTRYRHRQRPHAPGDGRQRRSDPGSRRLPHHWPGQAERVVADVLPRHR